jgi:drug/metabolite transporter (DMT)-like permease
MLESYVALTLLASLLFAIGNVMQKRGLPTRLGAHSIPALALRPWVVVGAVVRSPVWVIGLLLTAVAVGVETQALGLGDVSVVKPLSRAQSVFVLMLGVALLGERLRRREWLALGAVVAGAFVLGFDRSDGLTYLPSAPACRSAVVGVGSIVVALVVAAGWQTTRARMEVASGLAAGLLFGLGDVMVKVGTELAPGPAGHFDLTSGSSAGALLATAPFQVGVAVTIAAFVLQQIAFTRGRASVVVPVIGAGGMLVAIVLGTALLHERVGATRLAAIALMLAGTALLSPSEERCEGMTAGAEACASNEET